MHYNNLINDSGLFRINYKYLPPDESTIRKVLDKTGVHNIEELNDGPWEVWISVNDSVDNTLSILCSNQ